MAKAFLESLLYNIFRDQGQIDREKCRKAAEEIQRACPRLDWDQIERDARIVELRGSMTEAALAERFGISARHVRRIIHDHYITSKAIA